MFDIITSSDGLAEFVRGLFVFHYLNKLQSEFNGGARTDGSHYVAVTDNSFARHYLRTCKNFSKPGKQIAFLPTRTFLFPRTMGAAHIAAR